MSKTILYALRSVTSGRPDRVNSLLLDAFELEGWITRANGRPRLTRTGRRILLTFSDQEEQLPEVGE